MDDMRADARQFSGRIIGIAGASCSGKSTLSNHLAESIGADIFHFDDYWIRGCHKPIINGEPSFERPEQYDGDALFADVMGAIEKNPGRPIIMEGILVFMHEKIHQMCSDRFFLDHGSDELLIARRRARAQAGGGMSESDRSWLANGIEEWRQYGNRQRYMRDVVVLNALQRPKDILDNLIAVMERNHQEQMRPGMNF